MAARKRLVDVVPWAPGTRAAAPARRKAGGLHPGSRAARSRGMAAARRPGVRPAGVETATTTRAARRRWQLRRTVARPALAVLAGVAAGRPRRPA
eukprot:2741686-Alexandrium_andersonii.AAC.1